MATDASRRKLLTHAAVGLGVVACGRAFAGGLGQPAERAAYVAVETSGVTGRSRARFVTASGGPAGTVPLDFRAHGMARHGDLLAVFPRRPGTRFALVDRVTLEVRAVVDAPAGRHFYGHGAFTGDGRHLLVTENDLATLGGAVGIYEVASTRRMITLALPRPGPHDIHRAPGNHHEHGTDSFVVALGGLMTHPDYGRTPLNLGDFASETVTLDLDRGAVETMEVWPGTQGVSLRHVAADGSQLYVGGQRVAGAGVRGRGGVLWLVENGAVHALDPEDRLGGYVSSVAARDGRALATSKETGVVLHLEGARVSATSRIDGAAAAGLGGGQTFVSGFASLRAGDATVAVEGAHEFDNHGLALV